MKCEYDWALILDVEFANDRGSWKVGSDPYLALIQFTTRRNLRFPRNAFLGTPCKIVLGDFA
jgi:hypothetical protein